MPAARSRSSMVSTKNGVRSGAWALSACSSTCSSDSTHLFLSPSDDCAVLSPLSCSFDFTFNPIHHKPSQTLNLNATVTGRKQKEAHRERQGARQNSSAIKPQRTQRTQRTQRKQKRGTTACPCGGQPPAKRP